MDLTTKALDTLSPLVQQWYDREIERMARRHIAWLEALERWESGEKGQPITILLKKHIPPATNGNGGT